MPIIKEFIKKQMTDKGERIIRQQLTKYIHSQEFWGVA